MENKLRLTFIVVGGFLFIADRIFKTLSASAWQTNHLINSHIGWAPSVNTGIAFGLPLSPFLIITTSILLLIVLLEYFRRSEYIVLKCSIFLIILGAISNLFDRIFFEKTFDYLLLFTSLFNLADILIVAGVCIAILTGARKNSS